MQIRLSSCIFLAFAAGACGSPKPPPAVAMGHPIREVEIARVRPCETMATRAVEWFGEPGMRSADASGMTILQWVAILPSSESDATQTTTQPETQTVRIWVDASGRVAGIAVNPKSLQVPKACPPAPPPAPASAATPGA